MSLTDQHRIEIAADNCEVLRARLAKYEDAEGNPKAQPSGVVQWPDADEIMQMAFEEGQPSEDASGYYFELEEFDLFIQRLMEEVARLNSSPVSAGDDRETIRAVFLRNGFTIKEGQADLKPYVYAAADELMSIARAALSPAREDVRGADPVKAKLLENALRLSANRMDRLAIEFAHGSEMRWTVSEWAEESRAALSAPSHGEQVREGGLSRESLTLAYRLITKELETLANGSAIDRFKSAQDEFRSAIAAAPSAGSHGGDV